MARTPNPITFNQDNEISLDQLPVEVKAYKDKNGFALVLRSKDKRISNAEGKLVDTLLVRILEGEVPQTYGVHAIAVSDSHTQHVEVAESKVDEMGRLFITSATDGVQRPAAKQ